MANGKRKGREHGGGWGNMHAPDGGSDPSALTTQALNREIGSMRGALTREVEGLREMQDQRMDALERHLIDIFTIRIDGLKETVQQQFELVERQRVEQKKDTKDAVDAALTAQKEAVQEQTTASDRAIAKSEASTTRQLEQLTITFNNGIESLTQRLDEVKERQNQSDNRASTIAGAREQTVETRQQSNWSTGTMVAIATAGFMGLLGVGGIVIAIATYLANAPGA